MQMLQEFFTGRDSILDEFEELDLNFITRRVSKMADVYLLNFDEFKIVNKFGTTVDADAIAQKAKYKYLLLTSEESLEQLTVKMLVELNKNVGGLQAVKTKKDSIPIIWKLIKNLEFETVVLPEKKPAAKKGTGKKNQGIGEWVMLEMAKGVFDGKTNKEIADIANEKFPGATVSPKSASWYRWKLNKK